MDSSNSSRRRRRRQPAPSAVPPPVRLQTSSIEMHHQRTIVDAILAAVENPTTTPRLHFVDGPGGTGKTYICAVLHALPASAGHHSVMFVAYSGVAATLLRDDDRTAYKASARYGRQQLYVEDETQFEANPLQSTNIIWDEAPTAPQIALECADHLLRDISQICIPFGGKVLLLGGDFRQVLLVAKGGEIESVGISLKRSVLRPLFRQHRLTINQQTGSSDQAHFRLLLLDVNDEKISAGPDGLIELLPEYFFHGDPVEHLFGDDQVTTPTTFCIARSPSDAGPVLPSRVFLDTEKSPDVPFSVHRHQFPIKSCFAMSPACSADDIRIISPQCDRLCVISSSDRCG